MSYSVKTHLKRVAERERKHLQMHDHRRTEAINEIARLEKEVEELEAKMKVSQTAHLRLTTFPGESDDGRPLCSNCWIKHISSDGDAYGIQSVLVAKVNPDETDDHEMWHCPTCGMTYKEPL